MLLWGGLVLGRLLRLGLTQQLASRWGSGLCGAALELVFQTCRRDSREPFKMGKVFPQEFQLLQAFAKEILNWIRFIILIC